MALFSDITQRKLLFCKKTKQCNFCKQQAESRFKAFTRSNYIEQKKGQKL